MALTKEVVVDQIMINEDGTIFQREATVISEDGVEIIRSYHRTTINPGDDYSDKEQRVKDVADVVHTEAVKTAFAVKHAPKV